jgi:deaminated glutathione amidase
MASFKGFDWDRLRECTQRVLDLAREFSIWIVLGSSHELTPPHKPHNSLYIIDDRGRIAHRYDKMFCAGDSSEETGDWPTTAPAITSTSSRSRVSGAAL